MTSAASGVLALALALSAWPALAGGKEGAGSDVEAFFKAALHGSLSEVRSMVAADRTLVAARGRFGFTVLHELASEERFEVVEFLLGAGADPNAQGEDGIAPLHGASHPQFVELLCRRGARVDIRTNTGDTPLHSIASERGKDDVLQALLRSGADPRLTNKAGKTPYDIARSRADEAKMRILRKPAKGATRTGTSHAPSPRIPRGS